jgi:hypothetical protein
MGRATQFIDYINRDKEPTIEERRAIYTSITLYHSHSIARSMYRKRIKKQKEKK